MVNTSLFPVLCLAIVFPTAALVYSAPVSCWTMRMPCASGWCSVRIGGYRNHDPREREPKYDCSPSKPDLSKGSCTATLDRVGSVTCYCNYSRCNRDSFWKKEMEDLYKAEAAKLGTDATEEPTIRATNTTISVAKTTYGPTTTSSAVKIATSSSSSSSTATSRTSTSTGSVIENTETPSTILHTSTASTTISPSTASTTLPPSTASTKDATFTATAKSKSTITASLETNATTVSTKRNTKIVPVDKRTTSELRTIKTRFTSKHTVTGAASTSKVIEASSENHEPPSGLSALKEYRTALIIFAACAWLVAVLSAVATVYAFNRSKPGEAAEHTPTLDSIVG